MGGGACLGMAVLLLLWVPAGASESPSELTLLVPGTSIERPLEAGESEIFQLGLHASGHGLLTVEQLGIDVVVEVRDPSGRRLLRVDSPLGREGPEHLLLNPDTGGVYTVEVRSETRGAPAGRFEIRLDELPATTAADRLRLRGESAVTEAGRLHGEQEDGAPERAVEKLGEALDIWRRLGDPRREAETLLLLGAFLDVQGKNREAVGSLGEALELWRRLEDQAGEAATLDRLGQAHNSLGEYPQAAEVLEDALALRQELGQVAGGRQAGTRNRYCLAIQRLGRFREAGACYETTLEQAREVGDADLAATVLNNLGGIYRNLGEPEKQLQYLRQALELQRSLGDRLGEGAVLNNLGAFHRGLGEVEQALLDYAQALALFEGFGDRYWQARVLNNIGFAYLSLGELERARAYLLRALPLRRAVGDKAGEAVTLVVLGDTFSGLGDTGKALAFYRKALENNLATGNRRGAVGARRRLGDLYLKRHELVAARDQLEPALASLREMGNRAQEAQVLELLARVHLDAGELPPAKELAGRALELHRAVRSPVGEATALTTLARVDRRRGRNEAVRDHLEAALAALESVHGGLGDANQRASFLASQREVYELHVDVLMELHRRSPSAGYDRAALEASERARSRSLLGLLEGPRSLAEASAGPRAEPVLEERRRFAQRRFAGKTRRQLQVLGREHTAQEARVAEQELYEALTELDNVRTEIRRRDPRRPSWKKEEPLNTAAMQALLDKETVLLEFLLGEERSFLWWVTPTSVTAHELPPRARIEELAEQVHGQVSEIHQWDGGARESLAALGRMLLGPVADKLQGQRLVIVADGALHFVPFAALTLPAPLPAPLPSPASQPVIARHEVVHLPSASVLALQRRRSAGPPSAQKTVAILADPIFDERDARLRLDTLDRLPHTRREAEAIAAQVPAEGLLLALGLDARRERVVDDELSAFSILHFATHGFVNPRTPELSGLVLSQVDEEGSAVDGFLGLYDVAGLDLAAELVVLSGCRTALGKRVRGEGLVGLTRGFMYAGVPRVVASFWQVRDQATAELMARFYRGMLADGLTPATALRAAQLSLRQERRWRDPFYWAAFTLQGDWR